jgi:hypothetical protein
LLSLLECQPDCPQDAVELLANLMIPKSQHNDSMTSQEFRAHSIADLARAIVMSSAVQFDSHLRVRTIEIEDVIVEWVLATEFVAREISVS